MNRLLRIGFNILITSIIPIASWFLLGIVLDKNLVNVFSLTYPIQFISSILLALFGTGASIHTNKEKKEEIIYSGITLGSIIGIIIFGFILIHVDKYIEFMNMDITIYKTFCIYSILQIYLQLILGLILEKLYFEGKNKLANQYTIQFNLLNFLTLIGMSIFIKDQKMIVAVTLTVLTIYVAYLIKKNFKKFKLEIDILKWFQYDSANIVKQILMFIIYLVGMKNVFSYGEKYALVITFIALITDTQWDITHSVDKVAKIDLSKKKFNYKEHIKNAYKLSGILLGSIFIMMLLLYPAYQPDIKILSVFLLVEVNSFMLYPIYMVRTAYLQLEYSALKTTVNKTIAYFLRGMMSFVRTPYCTAIGQIIGSYYQLIYTSILWRKGKNHANSKEIKQG